MKMLNERQLQAHVSVVARLLMVTNGLLVTVYLLIIALTLVAPMSLLTDVLAFPALMVASGTPGLIAGFGLRERKAWARLLGIVGVMLGMAGLTKAFLLDNLALSMLIVYAVISVYAIFILMQKAVANYLALPKRPLETAS